MQLDDIMVIEAATLPRYAEALAFNIFFFLVSSRVNFVFFL